jgi:DNA-binding transcriptional MerR regulator
VPAWHDKQPRASARQNLRLYEARGLLQPERTDGGTRRYSANDFDRLQYNSDLLDAGLNLAASAWSSTSEPKHAIARGKQEEHRWLKTASASRSAQTGLPNQAPPPGRRSRAA